MAIEPLVPELVHSWYSWSMNTIFIIITVDLLHYIKILWPQRPTYK